MTAIARCPCPAQDAPALPDKSLETLGLNTFFGTAWKKFLSLWGMAKHNAHFRLPTADEQTVPCEMHLKLLVVPKDIQKCDRILIEQHYLHSAQLVGEQLRYAVVWKGQ